MKAPTPLQAALRLSEEFGLPVFPCRVSDELVNNKKLKAKSPLTLHGFKDATRTHELVEALFLRRDDALIGVPTGPVTGLLIIDIDPGGREWYEQNKHRLECPRIHRTRRDGMHLVYRYPKGARIRSTTGENGGIAHGVDVRAEGGYIIWWPAHGYETRGELAELKSPPAWLLEQLKGKPKRKSSSNGSAANSHVGEGGRNDFLNGIAYRMRKEGATLEEIYNRLSAENQTKCKPPLDDDEVRKIADGKAEITPDDDGGARQRIAELAKLSRIEYDRIRVDEAKALGIRTTTLDAEVAALHPTDNGPGLGFNDPEPWPDPVDGAALLEELHGTIERYVVLPPHAADALALWVMHSWAHDAFYVSPFVLVRSPGKRCGKTTLLKVLRPLMRRPLTASSVSTAAIYRTIERYRPTFVLDEVDTWLRDNEEMRGVLCGGHTRTTAFVVRVGGDNRDEPQMFSTFAPKVFAGIKRLADTIEDRAIAVNMRRKLPTESVSRLREDRYDRSVVDTQRRCCRWSKDQLETLRGADPHVPPGLDDRASDNWRPLLAIAELAGGDWPRRGRQAAIALSGQTDDEAEGVQLLGDIRDIFAKEGQGRKEEPDRLASAALVEALGKMEERPWAEWGRQGKPITAPQLARLLRPFEIAPRTIAFGTVRAKGYLLDQFEDAFSRYLPGPLSAVTPLLQHESGPQPTNPGRYPGEPVTVTSRYFSAELVSVTAGNRYPSNKVTAPDSTKQPENQRSNGVTAKKAEKGPTGEDTPAPDDQEAF